MMQPLKSIDQSLESNKSMSSINHSPKGLLVDVNVKRIFDNTSATKPNLEFF